MKKRDFADSHWHQNFEKWEYASEHYDGSYAIYEVHGGRLSHYLEQKYQRENNKAYEERMKITDPVLHFGTVVDSINGVLASKQDDTIRDFGALGDPDQKGTPAEQLWHNADGNGTNWMPFFKRVGIKLTVMQEIYGYVRGVTEYGEPCVKIIDPRNVVNRFPKSGEPTEVLICEKMDMRRSMYDGDDQTEVYTLFTLDGWEQYYYDGDDKISIDSGEYAYYADTTRVRRILPIFRTDIPMPRSVGYLLALKENHIFNQKSVRDFSVRNMSYAILRIGVDSEGQYNEIANQLEKGANVIAQYPNTPEHGYISPDSGYLAESQKILERDIEEFYINAFKKYGETAKMVTATQIKLESQSGIESFLNLLNETIDEFENQALWRLEQVYFPNNTAQWGFAYAKRSNNFQPEEMPDAKQLAEIAVNMERTGAASIETLVRTLHPTWDETEVTAEVQRINAQRGNSPVPPQLFE
jgi:hypothetical protein